LKKRIGLTLSGGGVKGVVHAGMIHYFDEIGLKPDIISGTSAGAIVGALYASGNTGKQIRDFFLNERPYSASMWAGKMGLIKTQEIKQILQKHMEHDCFEDLKIPLITTATNLMSGNIHYFSEGRLFDRVLASASFPGVFSPMEMDGALYSDGGILNHFPVDVIRNQSDFLIGMHLSPNKILQSSNLTSTRDILARAVDIQGSAAEIKKLALCDIALCPEELVQYSTFDFDKAKMHEMFDLGYAYIKAQSDKLIPLIS